MVPERSGSMTLSDLERQKARGKFLRRFSVLVRVLARFHQIWHGLLPSWRTIQLAL